MSEIVCPKCGEKDYFHEVSVIVSSNIHRDVTYEIDEVYCGRCDLLISRQVANEPQGKMAELEDALIRFGRRVKIAINSLVTE